MATFYWVGGSGTWDATSITNWASSSGGAGGAGVPTSDDNVIFDVASNAIAYTVTVGTNAACEDLTVAGPLVGNVTFSLAATARIDCHGSMTLPATGLTWTGVSGALITFKSTTTGKTVTTNGVTLTNTRADFSGAGGEWTLGSAFTLTAGFTLSVVEGTFNTGNFNITGGQFTSTGDLTRSINLGSSTVTLSATTVFIVSGLNLTWNSGTSTINCSSASPAFTGGGLTFYNVSFTSTALGTTTINGANTFNNLTQASRSIPGRRLVLLGDNQTVNGTLTLGATNLSTRRIRIESSVIGTQRTITLNGTLATLADVDFRNINAAGTVATPWTGTRLGNCLGNSNITFDAAKDCYRIGTGNWSATQWALTSGGAPGANNFPLAQDNAIFDTNTTTGTHTIDLQWSIGTLDCSALNVAVTIASGSQFPDFYKNIILDSNVTLTGTSAWNFLGQGTIQSITSAGVTFTQPIVINSPSGTVQLLDAFAQDSARTFTITNGTVQLKNGVTSTVGAFATSGTNQKFLRSTLAGSQATLSQASGTVNASYLTIQDINATGGATWNARTDLGSKDITNNTGWNFIFIAIQQILKPIMAKILQPIILN
jgi:hypothetical protein